MREERARESAFGQDVVHVRCGGRVARVRCGGEGHMWLSVKRRAHVVKCGGEGHT